MAAEVFCAFDADGSGYLTEGELWDALVSMGCDITQSSIKYLIKKIDSNSDGKVQLSEFEHLLYILQSADLASDASVLFYAADADHSGSIDAHELHSILTKMGINCSYERCTRLMQHISGRDMTYAEFMNLMLVVRQCAERVIATEAFNAATCDPS